MEKLEPSYIDGKNENGAVTAESSLEVPQMVKRIVTLALINSILDTQDN